MLTMAARQYDLDRLAAAAGLELSRHGGKRPEHGAGTEGLAALAHTLGLSHRHLRRLHAEGLTADQADRFATHLGKHPAWVWPHWWDDVDPDLDGHVTEPCRCGPDRRPIGRICDRCGHDLPRRDVRSMSDTG